MKILFVFFVLIISTFILYKTRKVKTEKEFTVANRRLNSTEVMYSIIGTLSGGVATIGTVQMAYMYGIAAWIFTLFSGIGCFILGLFFSRALRSEEYITVSEFIGKRFGKTARIYTSLLNSGGIYIHIVAQFLASISILEIVFGFDIYSSIIITFVLVLVFVISGGIVSSVYVGKMKIFMLYALMVFSTIVVISKQHGILNLIHSLPDKNMLSIFSYGKGKTIQDMIAMCIGILSTQTYIQAIFSAKDIRSARNGAFLSAALAPPIGLMAVIIGMYMRIHHPELMNNTVIVFPYFLKLYLNPIITAVFLSFLAVITIGSASGLTLGVTTNLYSDIIKHITKSTNIKETSKIKIIGVFILASSVILVITNLNSIILDWSYLSMGIRGSAVFLPLMLAIFIKSDKIIDKLKPVVFSVPLIYIMMSVILK